MNKKRIAQATIEITVAFMVMFMLLVATTKIFVWFCNNITERQVKFEKTRLIVDRGERGVGPEDVQAFNYIQPKLELIN